MRDLLGLLPPEHRQQVLERGRRRTYRKRDVIMHAGAPADAIYIIVEGHVGIRVTTPRGDEATIGLRGPGEVVGEMALVGMAPAPRSATVVAMGDVTAVAVHRAQFDHLVNELPSLSRWLNELLATRLRSTSAQLRDAMFEPVDVRLLRRLLEVADSFGSSLLPLTQDDLAAMAGATRPTVNRALRSAEERGWLRLSRGHVELVDFDALRRRADMEMEPWGG